MMFAAETFVDLITDPNHWLFEIAADAITGLAITLPIRALIRRHDRKAHGKVDVPVKRYVNDGKEWREAG